MIGRQLYVYLNSKLIKESEGDRENIIKQVKIDADKSVYNYAFIRTQKVKQLNNIMT